MAKDKFKNLKRNYIMVKLHNEHIITALNYEYERRIKELGLESPHGDYIFYSFEVAIDDEREDV
jgi:hypothetical protein|tara:strand:- start:877 stop:1068 length:192 start_codon:yes stop_codon:yes gene_type:complete